MNDKHDLRPFGIYISDNFLNEGSQDALLQPVVRSLVFPNRIEIRTQISKTFQLDGRHLAPTMVFLFYSTLHLSQSDKSTVPTPLQFLRNQTILRVDQVVLSASSFRFITRGLQVYVTIATNGTLLTRRNVERIASLGVKYVEISLDSSNPAAHDDFRGVPRVWARTVEGIKNVVAHPNIRCGMAVCFTGKTVKRAEEMLKLAVSLGIDTFVHFNFIPVGRGLEMAGEDMLPEQREELLNMLRRFLDEQKMGVMSTAPQFGRTCMAYGNPDSMMAMGHAGSGKGKQARVVAKYIGGCGALRCYCSIQPNGQVTPCVYMPSRIVGDLRKSSFAQIWDQPLEAPFNDREDRGDHCGVCDYRSFCGGCRARADGYTGDMLAGDPGCIYNRHMWEEITNRGRNGQEILCSLVTYQAGTEN